MRTLPEQDQQEEPDQDNDICGPDHDDEDQEQD
jgi:hypothetical protein